MTGQQLRNSILQEAIQGRLVSNVLLPGEKTGAELLQDILAERQKKENEEKGKKTKRLTLSIIREEPYELPDGWCWCKIGDIAEIERGGNFQKSDFVDTGYPCIHYGQIHMKLGPRTYSALSYLSKDLAAKQRKAHTGDIVMAVTSENIEDVCKCTAWLGESDVAIGAHTAIIRHYIDPVFLVYFFKSSLFYSQKKDLGHGSKVVEVTPGSLNNITLPLPPLSIQKAIVKKIEELFPLVNEYEKASVELNTLNNLLPDKLRKSVLQEALHGNLVSNDIPDGEETAPELLQQILKERQDRENKAKGKKAKKLTLSTVEEEPWALPDGWCWCYLDEIVHSECSISYGIVQPGDNVPGGVPVVRPIDMTQPVITLNGLKRVSADISNSYKRTILRGGELLISVRGTIGVVSFASNELAGGNVTRGIVPLFFPDIIDKEYVRYALSAPMIQKIIAGMTRGAALRGINMEDLRKLPIPLPPLSLQHRIVEKIEEVFDAIDKL